MNWPRFSAGLFLFGLFFIVSAPLDAQRKTRKIEIKGADDLIIDDTEGKKTKRLIGNVKIKHGKIMMECDSAHVFNETNTMYAYGNVHVYDRNKLHIYGDSLKYYGNKRLAEVRGREVILKQKDMVLTTQFINYDRANYLGYYWNGGNVLFNDGKDSLFSYKGYYHTRSRNMEFKDSVRLRTEDFNIKCDTLHYNSETQISKFYGPTYIESDSDLIYTELGWSNNKTKISVFTQNAYIISKEQELHGDSIYYDQKGGIGEVFYNVWLLDTINKFQVDGQYMYYNQKDSTSLVLGDPLLTQFLKNDSLYLHADTIYSEYDTSRQYRLIHAYPEAQIYKSDLQGKSDSLVFNDRDSSITLFHDPVIWSEDNQITAGIVTIFKSGDYIERMTMDYRGYIISMEDSLGQYKKYNQIKGDSMIGYFKDNKLRVVDVKHRGKTIYFAKQEDGSYIGMNKAECEYMTIYLDSNQVKQIVFKENPSAVLYPIKDVTPRMQFLKRFKWRGKERPLKREDVFNWKEEEETEGE